jgi:hypothetical protein
MRRSHLIGPSPTFLEHAGTPQHRSLNILSKIEACFVMLPFGSQLFTSYIIYTWKLKHGQTI